MIPALKVLAPGLHTTVQDLGRYDLHKHAVELEAYGMTVVPAEKMQAGPRFAERLREAILRALQEGDLLPPDLLEKMMQNPDASQNQQLRDLIDRLIERQRQADRAVGPQDRPP